MTTLDWADELDAIAATMPARTPIRVDPALAAALAEPDTTPPLPECVDCRRPMRPHRTRIADWPGTIARGCHQRCRGCYDRHKTGGRRNHPKIRVGQPCAGCGRPLRPHHTPLAEAPETVACVRAGRCQPCSKKET